MRYNPHLMVMIRLSASQLSSQNRRTCVPPVFFNATAPTEIYTLSLHDALPIWSVGLSFVTPLAKSSTFIGLPSRPRCPAGRAEEHTSELQSRGHLVCRLLL